MSASDSIRNDTAGVVAPPVLTYLAFLAAGVVADRLLFGWQTPLPAVARYGFGGVLIAFAAVLLTGALGRFRRMRTRPEPWKPTTVIVSSGVYAFTRNPMYVGMTAAYAAAALVADSPSALALLVPTVVIIHHGVILREERYLEARFGDEYLRYKARVRRWL